MPVLRCPRRTVTDRERDAIVAASLVERGVLPDQGGWQDQPATFVQAYPLAMLEIEHWRGVAREAAMKATNKGK